MDYKKLIEELIEVVMDCLESSIESIAIVKGKRMMQAFFVCLGFLFLSITMLLLELPIFISWQEVVPACIITGYLAFSETINLIVTNNIKNKLKLIRKRKQNKEGR